VLEDFFTGRFSGFFRPRERLRYRSQLFARGFLGGPATTARIVESVVSVEAALVYAEAFLGWLFKESASAEASTSPRSREGPPLSIGGSSLNQRPFSLNALCVPAPQQATKAVRITSDPKSLATCHCADTPCGKTNTSKLAKTRPGTILSTRAPRTSLWVV
jgi:hypothetical protein